MIKYLLSKRFDCSTTKILTCTKINIFNKYQSIQGVLGPHVASWMVISKYGVANWASRSKTSDRKCKNFKGEHYWDIGMRISGFSDESSA